MFRSQLRAAAHSEVSGKRQEPMPLVLGHEGGSVDRGLVSLLSSPWVHGIPPVLVYHGHGNPGHT